MMKLKYSHHNICFVNGLLSACFVLLEQIIVEKEMLCYMTLKHHIAISISHHSMIHCHTLNVNYFNVVH